MRVILALAMLASVVSITSAHAACLSQAALSHRGILIRAGGSYSSDARKFFIISAAGRTAMAFGVIPILVATKTIPSAYYVISATEFGSAVPAILWLLGTRAPKTD